ncbi:DUF2069 domain-containing protein [Halomonas sp. BMC7]|nr:MULTISPECIES: DUF2069 domain-containing protein [Halomonas]MDI4638406.1 DUF2069 domain-containing protein [Halomonas sp. BMC7]NUJ59394.1 DUF2069 domain-containing protein [Halomonas taeanensis]
MRQRLERMEDQQGLDTMVDKSRRLVITSYLALLVLLSYGGLIMHDVQTDGWGPWLVRVIPLLLFLPSILVKRARGHAWLCFVSLLYFMQGVMFATLPGQTAFGLLVAMASLALFVASLGYARFRSRQLRHQSSGHPQQK